MIRIINCECGHVIRGATDEEVLGNCHAHMREYHPAMIGAVSDQDILAMVEEGDPAGGGPS